MLQILFVIALSLSSAYSCEVPTCDGLEVGDLIPVIENCRDYRICLEDGSPSTAVLSCDSNEHFVNGSCTRDTEEWRCIPQCLPVSCSSECEMEIDFIPNPDDCNSYTLCVSGDLTNETCPDETPYFDAVTRECTDSAFNCCFNDFAYCDETFVEIADPNDCNAFFLCLYEGVPADSDRYFCGEGEKFEDGECVVDEDGSCSAKV